MVDFILDTAMNVTYRTLDRALMLFAVFSPAVMDCSLSGELLNGTELFFHLLEMIRFDIV